MQKKREQFVFCGMIDKKKITSLTWRKKDSDFIIAFKDKENKILDQATGF